MGPSGRFASQHGAYRSCSRSKFTQGNRLGEFYGLCDRTGWPKKDPVVFLLWGSPAQKKADMLHNPNHLVLKAPHPSPLSAYRGFFGCRHFSKTNEFLEKNGLEPIDWQIENIWNCLHKFVFSVYINTTIYSEIIANLFLTNLYIGFIIVLCLNRGNMPFWNANGVYFGGNRWKN